MTPNTDKAEEELRSHLYSALLELSFASHEEKASVVERVFDASRALRDAIVQDDNAATEDLSLSAYSGVPVAPVISLCSQSSPWTKDTTCCQSIKTVGSSGMSGKGRVETVEIQNAPATTLLRGVALALVVVACTLFPRLLLHGILEDRSTFTLFTLGVMICARFGGAVSGVVATAISIAAAVIVFLGPARDETERAADLIEIILFAFAGLGITWLAQHLRDATLQAKQALEQVRTLTGLLPICAWCKKIQDEADQWQPLERYISQRSEAQFTHGLCPECATRMETESQVSKLRADR
jgi:hypothetical protein